MIFILLVFMAIVSFITKQYFPGLSNLFATGMSIEVITSLIFLGIIAHLSHASLSSKRHNCLCIDLLSC